MQIVFMGSAPLSCASLEALLAMQAVQVVGVVTQPDRPKGRHLLISPCDMKRLAMQHGLRVLTPENVNAPDSVDAMAAMKPDLVVVVAYGQILRKALLAAPPLGCVNVHASLLPTYRGAAPIQRAIAEGDTLTGVTTIFMNERMDAGDIILQEPVPIMPEDTAASLQPRLAEAGAALLVRTVALVGEGAAPRRRQAEAEATLAPKLTKPEGRLDWTLPARDLHNRVRAFNPWPCCFCEEPTAAGDPAPAPARCLKVLATRVEETASPTAARPGELVESMGDGPLVGTGLGLLRLLTVQPEGKRAMSGASYLRGRGLTIGQLFG